MDTLLLSYAITRNFVFAGSIATAESITKVLLYYLHERTWAAIRWGKETHEHPSDVRSRIGVRPWIIKGASTALDRAVYLRHLWNPAKLATIAAFLVCFAIIVNPRHSLVDHSEQSVLATTHDTDMAAADSPGGAMVHPQTQIVIPESSDGAFGPSSPRVELARGAPALSSMNVNSVDTLPPVLLQMPGAETPVEMPRRDLLDPPQAEEVQRRLIELGYLSTSATGVWGPRSREALRGFKADHDLAADDRWDEATERNLFADGATQSFVGMWGTDARACSPRLNQKGLLPAIIDDEGAWAGETFCAFHSKKQTGGGWVVVAECANTHDRWTANVQLVVTGNRLTWTSQRGSQTYFRCKPGPSMASSL